MFARQPVAALPSLQINFPNDWLASLTDLLKVLQTPFERVDALLVAMADDFAGGVMLRWLLYLFPKSRREDGAIYKSAIEWQAQAGFSKHQVDRLKKYVLPHCGVDVTIKKANGAPTCHYYLDGWRFLRRLGVVLRLPIPYLLIKLQQSGNPFTGKREMDLPESGKTLTTDSPNESNKQVVNDSVVVSIKTVELLKKAGVNKQDALTYAALPEDIIEACITSANDPGVKYRVAYLIGALKKQLQAHNAQVQSSKPLSESADTEAPPPNPLPIADESVSEAAQSAQEKWADVLARLHDTRANVEPAPEAVNKNLAVIIREGLTAQAAWSTAYHQLELQLDRSSFDTYLRSAKLTDYEPDTSTFIVKVHNSYARDMLQHRFYRNVARILRDVTGREVAVRFEADEQSADASGGLKRFLAMKSKD